VADKKPCPSAANRYNLDMQQKQEIEAIRQQVYQIVSLVPPGRVTTYGQIAEMIPPPEGMDPHDYARVRAQWVGRAMRHAPQGVPWQRVINSQGRISLPAGSRGAMIQRQRLEAEGILFTRGGTIDLGRFGWEGPPPPWAQDRGFLAPRSLRTPAQLDLFGPDAGAGR
jgi:methylated-DNA-protein-cysteine methyltransferase related protein